jgi:hypothetical protein
MLFQPAIMALLFASGVSLAMMLAATPFAVQVIRGWDIASGSERQLALERLTYLFSTLLVFVFATQLASLLLFVFNADKMSEMFVGAMCAVGTLNVNAFGFPSLISQIVLFFLAAAWLAVNSVDTQARDYPLVRIKYSLMLGLIPVMALVSALQLFYFLGLEADVITSCCGSLFSTDAKTIAGEVSSLEPLPAMAVMYGALALAIASALFHTRTGLGGYAVAAASAAAFVGGVVGILSFVSLYVYEHPHHHCPFCLLKPEYDYIGYWLYIPLFVATAAGLGVGAVRPFVRVASLTDIVPASSRRLALFAGLGFACFTIVALALTWRSNLRLFES